MKLRMVERLVLGIFISAISMATLFAQTNENPASNFKYSLNMEGDGVVIEEYLGKRKDVVIPAMIEKIPVVAIDGFSLTGITSVVIPDTVRIIGDYAFSHCPLTQVTLPKSLKEIGAGAFRDCQLTSLVLPDSTEKVEQSSFENNPITELTLAKFLKQIHARAFL